MSNRVDNVGPLLQHGAQWISFSHLSSSWCYHRPWSRSFYLILNKKNILLLTVFCPCAIEGQWGRRFSFLFTNWQTFFWQKECRFGIKRKPSYRWLSFFFFYPSCSFTNNNTNHNTSKLCIKNCKSTKVLPSKYT